MAPTDPLTPEVHAPSAPAPQILRAALWMLGAVASFSAMAVAGRAVSLDHDTFEIMLYRSIVGFVIVLVVAGATGHLTKVRRDRLGLHTLRNLFHFAGQNLWFLAITLIPLAQVFALEFTSPIWVVALEFTSPLWVLVLSPLVLGERLTRIRVLAATFGFIGILMVTRPSPETLNLGQLAAAAAALCFAGSILATKRLTRNESLTSILFWMTLMQIGLGLVCAGFDGDIALPSAASLPWLIVVACGGLMAHYCLTTALSIAPATLVTPVDFLRLPLIAMIGLMVYAEPIDLWVFLGAAVIFGANYLNLWSETRGRR